MNDTPTVTILSGAAQTGEAGTEKPETRALPLGTIIDARGRKIVVKSLDALEEFRLAKIMGPHGESSWARSIALQACAVRSIDGDPEAFINNDRDIELMVQRLGSEGFEAVSTALAELNEAKPKSNKVAAKN